MSLAKTLWQCGQVFSLYIIQLLMASSTIIFFCLMLFVQPSLFAVMRKTEREIERVYQLHRRLCSAMPMDGAAVTKFKSTKINSEGLL